MDCFELRGTRLRTIGFGAQDTLRLTTRRKPAIDLEAISFLQLADPDFHVAVDIAGEAVARLVIEAERMQAMFNRQHIVRIVVHAVANGTLEGQARRGREMPCHSVPLLQEKEQI